MKSNIKKISLVFSLITLGSCDLIYTSNSISSNSSYLSSSISQSAISSSSIISSSSEAPMVDETIHIYSINDFHGSILENDNGNYYEGGLKKVFGYLRKKKLEDPNHTIILSGGDVFQGSYESNRNYGNLIVEAMNKVGFTASTLGNHDFDYGIDKLEANMNLANFPFLAGNITYFGSSTSWGKSSSSVIFNTGRRKIGIIGNIGQGQTTSIISSAVSNLTFNNPRNYIINESISLKNQGCSLIISQVHDSIENAKSYGDLSSYIDGMLCAHSHQDEDEKYYGVPYQQAACNGEMITHFEYVITKDNQIITITTENITASTRWSEDSAIATIQDRYLDSEYKTKVNAQLGTIKGGTYLSKQNFSRLLAKSIYFYASNKYSDIALAMVNDARSTLPTPFTYSDVYKCAPFTNNIVIMYATGQEIKHEASFSSTFTYTGDNTYSTLNDNSLYKLAVIDYLAIHQNTSKRYDYFSSLNDHPDYIIQSHNDYPPDILENYINTTLNNQVKVSDCISSASGMDLYRY